jgi:hypothetical protein
LLQLVGPLLLYGYRVLNKLFQELVLLVLHRDHLAQERDGRNSGVSRSLPLSGGWFG